MSKVINMVGGGGGTEPTILLAFIGQRASTTMDAPSVAFFNNESDYFIRNTNYSDYAHYICQKAGTYTFRLSVRSTYPASSSTRTTMTARIYIGTSYGSRELSSPSNSSSYVTAEYTVTLAVGNTIGLNAAISSGSALCPVNLLIIQ